jgi:hypothetical protein
MRMRQLMQEVVMVTLGLRGKRVHWCVPVPEGCVCREGRSECGAYLRFEMTVCA